MVGRRGAERGVQDRHVEDRTRGQQAWGSGRGDEGDGGEDDVCVGLFPPPVNTTHMPRRSFLFTKDCVLVAIISVQESATRV